MFKGDGEDELGSKRKRPSNADNDPDLKDTGMIPLKKAQSGYNEAGMKKYFEELKARNAAREALAQKTNLNSTSSNVAKKAAPATEKRSLPNISVMRAKWIELTVQKHKQVNTSVST
jgi:hypothetical protein